MLVPNWRELAQRYAQETRRKARGFDRVAELPGSLPGVPRLKDYAELLKKLLQILAEVSKK